MSRAVSGLYSHMNLFAEVYRFARWTLGVTRRFLRVRLWSTITVTTVSAVDGVLQLLAFLVPLKIILLAASPGVPRYFPFIEPSNKASWIVGLSLGAVGAYLLSLTLNALSERWSKRAGRDVLRVANDLPVSAKEEEQIQRTFLDFTNVLGSSLFLVVAGFILVLVNTALAVFLGLMILLLGVVSSLILASDERPVPPLKAWVTEKTKPYLGFWQVLTFFGAFGVIVYPFLTAQSGNIFLAIIGFILIRRMLGTITGVISTAVGLTRRRPVIDALIYRSQQLKECDREDHFRGFRVLFLSEQRDPMIARVLRGSLCEDVEVSTNYVDPEPSQVKRFDVKAVSRQTGPLRFEARIFPKNCQDQVASAAFLFQHIQPNWLHAPRIHGSVDYHGYTVIVQEAGSGARCHPGKAWRPVKRTLVTDILCMIPPKPLIKSYRNTRLMLPDRLSRQLCERLWIGVDNTNDANLVKWWLSCLPSITRALREQPLALYNPDVSPSNVIDDPDEPLALSWGRWALEPLGVAMARYGIANDGAQYFERLKSTRADLSGRCWAGDVQLGVECHALEQAIAKEHYKVGLSTVAGILEMLGDHTVIRPPAWVG